MKIPKLKPNSPEFWHDKDQAKPSQRLCDHKDCLEAGLYPAPKSRGGARDYFWFCKTHVEAYNKSWDFFKGASPDEIEKHRYESIFGDRPTWKMSQMGKMSHEQLKRKVYEGFAFDSEAIFHDFLGTDDKNKSDEYRYVPKIPKPELDALKTLGFDKPSPWQEIKSKYKALIKQYHPDLNQNNDKAEEMTRKINAAYAILKLAFKKLQTYDQIKD